jgi:hypothetical protein
MKPAADVNDPGPSAEPPGLPGLRSWNAVYLAVVVIFIVWVGLLALLPRLYQ